MPEPAALTTAAPPFPALFAELPAPLAARFDPAAPWALLGEPLDALFAALPADDIQVRLPPDVHLAGDRIVIERGVRLHPGAVIEGPVFIGRGTEVRPGAYIRGGVWIGDGCVVGANVEIKRAILLPTPRRRTSTTSATRSSARGVNLGAGTILSNFRHDGGEIRIPLPGGGSLATGRRKLGAVLGDGVLTGCNCVLHPGCVVGRGTQIYPGVQLRPGLYPERSIVKLRQELEVVPLST